MKVATLKDGSRDGRPVVVSRDRSRAADVGAVAPTLPDPIERWDDVADALRNRFDALRSGAVVGEPFDPCAAHAPLPRAPQYAQGTSIFGAIDQRIVPLDEDRAGTAA